MRSVVCTEKQNSFFVLVLKFYTGYAKIADVRYIGVRSGQKQQWLHNIWYRKSKKY
jgi:hypothetical protein